MDTEAKDQGSSQVDGLCGLTPVLTAMTFTAEPEGLEGWCLAKALVLNGKWSLLLRPNPACAVSTEAGFPLPQKAN